MNMDKKGYNDYNYHNKFFLCLSGYFTTGTFTGTFKTLEEGMQLF